MANIAAEMTQFWAQKALRTYLGAVKPCSKKNTVKVIVTELKMDHNLTAVSALKLQCKHSFRYFDNFSYFAVLQTRRYVLCS